MRALLSVYDKSGVVELARALHELGWDLVSSGGTARAIAEAGVPVTDVADLTGFPAILGHRVVTLHPKVHGGILADPTDPAHRADMDTYGIEPIDLVVANLYPFSSEPSIELIDIGGPTMVRAAAKNHAHVGIVTDPARYDEVLAELRADGRAVGRHPPPPGPRRLRPHRGLRRGDPGLVRRPGRAAGERTTTAPAELPETISLTLDRAQVLRYGENPHQVGARYTTRGSAGWWASAVQHGGKEMSYLNVYDTEAAWNLVHSLGEGPAAVVMKHANPCGVALDDDITTRLPAGPRVRPGLGLRRHRGGQPRGHAGDGRGARAGVHRGAGGARLPPRGARAAAHQEEEPPGARPRRAPGAPGLLLRNIDGGFLVQSPDPVTVDRSAWQVVTRARPTEAQSTDLELAWRVVARVTSNSIVLVKDRQAVGIGCGQQNRRDAGQLACQKADGRAAGGAYASDAFFPFPDGLDGAVEAGAACVIQPGGSIRDDEVVAAADERGAGHGLHRGAPLPPLTVRRYGPSEGRGPGWTRRKGPGSGPWRP